MIGNSNFEKLYFQYICQLVEIDDKSEYYELIKYLMNKPFNYTLPMDGNREVDGINLRYRFGSENGIPSSIIASEIDFKECSMLEMLIALSVRANDIISSEDWPSGIFWEMIKNLGLISQTNDHFNKNYCDMCISRFLNHEYQPDGKGGLVTIQDPPMDLRYVEIWDQIMWWLDDEF